MDVGTDLARRALARPDALTLAPRVARSLARFAYATAFNQDLRSWNVIQVTSTSICFGFCLDAGISPPWKLPTFPPCGKPDC